MSLYQLHGRTPLEALTGNMPDISEFLEFKWYQPIWIFDPSVFPDQQKKIGRWIGVAHRVGQAMCYWVLPPSSIPIARTMIQAITKDELATNAIKKQLTDYDVEIAIKLSEIDNNAPLPDLCLYMEDEAKEEEIDNEPYEPEACMPNVDNSEVDTYDELLLAEPLLPRGRL